MTQNSKYSADVETMTINNGGNSWDRQRSTNELQTLRERLISKIGELDLMEYALTA